MLHRVVVPSRFALIYRGGETLGYNPAVNTWERLEEDTAEVLRWLRAGRQREGLEDHLVRRFGYSASAARERLRQGLVWCLLRRVIYLDQELPPPEVQYPDHTLDTLYWICTQACNLRCIYCYQDAAVRRPNELSTAEGRGLVDQAVEAGVSTFVFTGGEPFVRRDLLHIASYSRARGLLTNVITNGHYVTARNVKHVAEVFDTVTVSLDHGVAEYHDRNRGRGSWGRAVRAIELLLDQGVNVDVNSVLSRLGLQDVQALLRFSRTHRIGEHRIVPQFPMGRGTSTRDDELAPEEVMGVSDRLQQVARELNEAGQSRISPEGTYSTKRIIRDHCGAALSEVSVDPQGWVYPCRLLQCPVFKTHNIRQHRLIDIFNAHPMLRKVRGTVASTLHPCQACIIRNHCGGGCRGIHFSFTHSYTDSHPLFCAYLRGTFEVQAWASTGEVPRPRRAAFANHRRVAAGVGRAAAALAV